MTPRYMVSPYNCARTLRTRRTFLDFSHATIGSSTILFMLPRGIPLKATWEHLFEEILRVEKGDLGEHLLVGSPSSTSNLETCYNLNLCNVFQFLRSFQYIKLLYFNCVCIFIIFTL